MQALFKFEWKRLNRSKATCMAIILIVLIGVLGCILNQVFYAGLEAPKECLISVFNSYTQFTYLILGFLFVQNFAKDYKQGVAGFYNQMGFGIMKQNFCKMLVLITVTIPAIDFFIIMSSIYYGNSSWKFLLLMLLIIDLSTLYIILLAMLVASFGKSVVGSVLVFYGLFIGFNVINLLGFGLSNPADGNSISTYLFSEYAGRRMNHYSLDKIREHIVMYKVELSLGIPAVWCLILGILNFCFFTFRKKSN